MAQIFLTIFSIINFDELKSFIDKTFEELILKIKEISFY